MSERELKGVIKLLAVLLGVAIIWGLYQNGQASKARMELYSLQNNCKWHYSEYIDRDPVCK